MRRIIDTAAIAFVMLVLSSRMCGAQTAQSRHLTYKGIPLTGSLTHFHNELERKGFTPARDEASGTECHRGVFASYRAKVTTLATPLTGTIYGTRTCLDEHGTWSEILADFDTFKYHLTEVYGGPSGLKEEFQGPYSQEDGYSMRALSESKASYMAEWTLANGTIRISVVQTSQGAGCLLIEYLDKENLELKEKELTTIIRKDL